MPRCLGLLPDPFRLSHAPNSLIYKLAVGTRPGTVTESRHLCSGFRSLNNLDGTISQTLPFVALRLCTFLTHHASLTYTPASTNLCMSSITPSVRAMSEPVLGNAVFSTHVESHVKLTATPSAYYISGRFKHTLVASLGGRAELLG